MTALDRRARIVAAAVGTVVTGLALATVRSNDVIQQKMHMHFFHIPWKALS